MASEHGLFDKLLARAARGSVDAYLEFRQRLLRHIRIEERLLLPMAEKKRGGEPLPFADRLRLDHGALAALMMVSLSRGTFWALSAVLKPHNPLEENSGGVYDQCEALAGPGTSELLLQCEKTRPVPCPLDRRSESPGGGSASAHPRRYAASLLDEGEPE